MQLRHHRQQHHLQQPDGRCLVGSGAARLARCAAVAQQRTVCVLQVGFAANKTTGARPAPHRASATSTTAAAAAVNSSNTSTTTTTTADALAAAAAVNVAAGEENQHSNLEQQVPPPQPQSDSNHKQPTVVPQVTPSSSSSSRGPPRPPRRAPGLSRPFNDAAAAPRPQSSTPDANGSSSSSSEGLTDTQANSDGSSSDKDSGGSDDGVGAAAADASAQAAASAAQPAMQPQQVAPSLGATTTTTGAAAGPRTARPRFPRMPRRPLPVVAQATSTAAAATQQEQPQPQQQQESASLSQPAASTARDPQQQETDLAQHQEQQDQQQDQQKQQGREEQQAQEQVQTMQDAALPPYTSAPVAQVVPQLPPQPVTPPAAVERTVDNNVLPGGAGTAPPARVDPTAQPPAPPPAAAAAAQRDAVEGGASSVSIPQPRPPAPAAPAYARAPTPAAPVWDASRVSPAEKLQIARAALQAAMAADSSRIWDQGSSSRGQQLHSNDNSQEQQQQQEQQAEVGSSTGSLPAAEGVTGTEEGAVPAAVPDDSSSSSNGSGGAAVDGTHTTSTTPAPPPVAAAAEDVAADSKPVSAVSSGAATPNTPVGSSSQQSQQVADSSSSSSSSSRRRRTAGVAANDSPQDLKVHSRQVGSSATGQVESPSSNPATAAAGGRRRRRSSAASRTTTITAAAAPPPAAATATSAAADIIVDVAGSANRTAQEAALEQVGSPPAGSASAAAAAAAPPPPPPPPPPQEKHREPASSSSPTVAAEAGRAAAAAAQETVQQQLDSAAVLGEPTAPETAAEQPATQDGPAAPAAAMAAPRRRVRSATEPSSAGGTGVSAAAVEQLLARQRSLGAATRRAARSAGSRRDGGGSSSNSSGGGNSGSSNSSSSMQAPGEIVQLHGQWKLTGFTADLEAMNSLVPALQKRLSSAVQAEQDQEQAAIKKLYAAGSLRQLQRDGIVLLQLQATPSHVLYSSMVWRFSLQAAGHFGQQGSSAGGGGAAAGAGGGARGRDLPYHRFRQGDSLLVSRFSEDQLVEVGAANSRSHGMQRASAEANSSDLRPGSQDFRALDATVVEVRKDHLLLALEKFDSDRMQQEVRLAAAAPMVTWRLDQSVRDTTARRQLDAVKRLSQPTTDSPFEALLRMVLVGTVNGAYGATVPPEWVRDAGWRQDVKQLLAQTQGLNNSQRRAIALAVLRSFTLWQGPPGTGKTRTLLALVEVLVKTAQRQARRWTAMGPILACGDTNAAVDNLVEGLVHKGLRVVRLGQPAKVRAQLQQFTLEAQAEKTPDGQRALQLRQDSRVFFEQSKQASVGSLLSWGNKSRTTSPALIRSGRSKQSDSAAGPAAKRAAPPAMGSSEALEKAARSKWAEAERLAKRAAQQVLQEAQVVCATCSGAGDPLLNNLHFNMIVIDEATQATEPATLVPLTQGARCVVMAGDPAQLPPTVTSQEAAQEHGLRVTLFERLALSLGLEPLLLDTQYRMNPAISAFPSRQFYAGKLTDGVTAEQKPAAAGLAWPQPEQPVMVVAVQGVEEQAKKNKARAAGGSNQLLYGQDAAAAAAPGGLMESSYSNLQEARVALQAVYALMTAGDAQTAAILTPYKGQVRACEHALRVLSPWFGPDLMSRITVSSVDGYQGREADVVLFSAVRCNAQGRIGFVSDRRRLNVAITRPRRGLVVVCSPETLQKGSNDWKAFLDWAQDQRWITEPHRLPAAPWQTEGVDPFDEGGCAANTSSITGSSGGSWSSVASSDEESIV